MMRELLSALALIFTLSGVPVCAADSSPSRPTQLAQSQPAESACQADCRTKFDTCNNAHVFAISILMGRVCNAATDRLDEGMGAFDEMKRFSVECVFLEV